MSCVIGEVTESLENENVLWRMWSDWELGEWAELIVIVTPSTSQFILILQAFHHFTYVTAHSPTLSLLYLCHNSFSNPSVASPTSQLILQPFFCFSYVTGFSLMSPGEPPMIPVRLSLSWMPYRHDEGKGKLLKKLHPGIHLHRLGETKENPIRLVDTWDKTRYLPNVSPIHYCGATLLSNNSPK